MDMKRHLVDYIRVETDIMSKRRFIGTKMRLQTARKQQDILKAQQELETPPLVAGEGFNITDSDVFSFAGRDSHLKALNTTAPGRAEITTSTPIQAEGTANDKELLPRSSTSLVIPESLSIPPITSSMGAAMAAPAEAEAEEAAITFSWSGRRARQHCKIKHGRANGTYVRRSGPVTCQPTTDKGGRRFLHCNRYHSCDPTLNDSYNWPLKNRNTDWTV
jgi:hypothetical protein